MRKCRTCLKDFEPESFEVYCSADCSSTGNSASRELTTRQDGFQIAVVKETPGWSEGEFQEAIEKIAKEKGWQWYHTRDSRKSRRGWPDLVLWRDRIVYMELKDEDGVASADQLTTIEQLKAAGGEVYLFRPSDWLEIVRVLA